MGRNTYGEGEGDTNAPKAWEERGLKRAELFEKGQSRRIWAELYKVGVSQAAGKFGRKGLFPLILDVSSLVSVAFRARVSTRQTDWEWYQVQTEPAPLGPRRFLFPGCRKNTPARTQTLRALGTPFETRPAFFLRTRTGVSSCHVIGQPVIAVDAHNRTEQQ